MPFLVPSSQKASTGPVRPSFLPVLSTVFNPLFILVTAPDGGRAGESHGSSRMHLFYTASMPDPFMFLASGATAAAPLDDEQKGAMTAVVVMTVLAILALFFGVLIVHAIRRSLSRVDMPSKPAVDLKDQPDVWRESGRRLRVEPAPPTPPEQESDQ